jgi:hypothetical protein
MTLFPYTTLFRSLSFNIYIFSRSTSNMFSLLTVFYFLGLQCRPLLSNYWYLSYFSVFFISPFSVSSFHFSSHVDPVLIVTLLWRHNTQNLRAKFVPASAIHATVYLRDQTVPLNLEQQKRALKYLLSCFTFHYLSASSELRFSTFYLNTTFVLFSICFL